MPTKAELEDELTRLKAELASRPKVSEPEEATTDDSNDSGVADLLNSLGETDFEGLVRQLTDEIESTVKTRPLLTIAGAVLLGYAIGRIR